MFGVFMVANEGLVLGGGSDLFTFRAGNCYCNPATYKTVAPGYAAVPVTDALLAGAKVWTPDRMEVYALEFRYRKY